MRARSPSAVVASGTPRGNELLARVAAITDLPLARQLRRVDSR
jgi:electron transfer flavoprotein alpha subunit